ncbi:helix-turn-helix transcriptional regulator [Paucibacter soli]|uniref:helix-turn-helix transcriptional regulator n=1 Tax=Paucibacter soli TaxID=3133433 RepID=UPI0030A44819
MSPPLSPATLERFSAAVLQLGALAREVCAADFLGQAVAVLRAQIPFERGWWGLGTDLGPDKLPAVYQTQYIGLPDSFAAEWRAIAQVDDFAERTLRQAGQVQRFEASPHDDSPPQVQDFGHRHGLDHGMALRLDALATGHGFFMALYRDAEAKPFDDTEALLFKQLLLHCLQLWHQSLREMLSAAAQEELTRAAVALPDGRLLFAGPALCELLWSSWPHWDGIALPAELLARLRQLPQRLRLPRGTLQASLRGEHLWLLRHADATGKTALAPRKMRVVHLFAQGRSYKEIARELALSPATVRTYLRDAYLSLGVSNKVQLGEVLREESLGRS